MLLNTNISKDTCIAPTRGGGVQLERIQDACKQIFMQDEKDVALGLRDM